MATQGSIACGICGDAIPVQLVRVSGAGEPTRVQIVDDRPMVDHMRTCKGSPLKALADTTPVAQPAKVERPPLRPNPYAAFRIGQFLEAEGYVSYGGSRACTMCGTRGDACLDQLRKEGTRPGCCPACHNGNTHPAPGEAVGSCAEWAAEKVGPLR